MSSASRVWSVHNLAIEILRSMDGGSLRKVICLNRFTFEQVVRIRWETMPMSRWEKLDQSRHHIYASFGTPDFSPTSGVYPIDYLISRVIREFPNVKSCSPGTGSYRLEFDRNAQVAELHIDSGSVYRGLAMRCKEILICNQADMDDWSPCRETASHEKLYPVRTDDGWTLVIPSQIRVLVPQSLSSSELRDTRRLILERWNNSRRKSPGNAHQGMFSRPIASLDLSAHDWEIDDIVSLPSSPPTGIRATPITHLCLTVVSDIPDFLLAFLPIYGRRIRHLDIGSRVNNQSDPSGSDGSPERDYGFDDLGRRARSSGYHQEFEPAEPTKCTTLDSLVRLNQVCSPQIRQLKQFTFDLDLTPGLTSEFSPEVGFRHPTYHNCQLERVIINIWLRPQSTTPTTIRALPTEPIVGPLFFLGGLQPRYRVRYCVDKLLHCETRNVGVARIEDNLGRLTGGYDDCSSFASKLEKDIEATQKRHIDIL